MARVSKKMLSMSIEIGLLWLAFAAVVHFKSSKQVASIHDVVAFWGCIVCAQVWLSA